MTDEEAGKQTTLTEVDNVPFTISEAKTKPVFATQTSVKVTKIIHKVNEELVKALSKAGQPQEFYQAIVQVHFELPDGTATAENYSYRLFKNPDGSKTAYLGPAAYSGKLKALIEETLGPQKGKSVSELFDLLNGKSVKVFTEKTSYAGKENNKIVIKSIG